MKTSIILLGAGEGKRIWVPKLFLKLAGKTLLEWNLDIMADLHFEKEVILVVRKEDFEKASTIAETYEFFAEIYPVIGGKERIDSVKAGLKACCGEIILIHNIANPLAEPDDFEKLQKILSVREAACFVGQSVVDTLRRVKKNRSTTIDRDGVFRVQTPQGFWKTSLEKKLSPCHSDRILGQSTEAIPRVKDNTHGIASSSALGGFLARTKLTDEIALFEDSDLPIVPVETSPLNQKITFLKDLEFLEQYLRTETLTGIAEDSHAFGKEGKLKLGGLELAKLPKLEANSDGDVLLHALFNAISSALGKHSLGQTADQLVKKGITDSSEFIKKILKEMNQEGFSLQNISVSFECSRPKIDPLVKKLKKSLSKLLKLDPLKIGITATTGENLSPFGKGKGIRCKSIVTLVRY